MLFRSCAHRVRARDKIIFPGYWLVQATIKSWQSFGGVAPKIGARNLSHVPSDPLGDTPHVELEGDTPFISAVRFSYERCGYGDALTKIILLVRRDLGLSPQLCLSKPSRKRIEKREEITQHL